MGIVLSRRGLMAATASAVALLAAGCRSGSAITGPANAATTERPKASAVAPDPALLAAITGELALISAYTAAIRSMDGHSETLERLQHDHRDHHRALIAALPTNAGLGNTTTRFRNRPVLSKLEAASERTLRQAALTLTGTDASVIASIAASHASHVVVLASGSAGSQ